MYKRQERAVGTDIIIEPFERSKVNPNSYNLTLHNELLVYENEILDMKKPNPTKKLVIPEEGLLLEPNKLYLGRTKEFTTTSKYVPMLEGRSSTGRLGLCIHCLLYTSIDDFVAELENLKQKIADEDEEGIKKLFIRCV